MNERRSIQDIIPPARSKPIRPQVAPPAPPPPAQQTPPPQPPRPPEENFMMSEPPRRSSWPFIAIAVGAVVVVVAVVGVMSTLFHTATADVVLSEWKSDISGSYTAGDPAPLSYTPVTVEEKASKTVAASGSAQAEDRASGTIIVSNLGAEQRLITNTRFESKNGLIYRIHTPIVVPAATTKNGVKTAGTIEAVVYADEPGDKYNIGVTDFTVPGLKNTPQFTQVTAKSKAAMSGGFVGMRATVQKSVRDAAVQELKAELDRTLRDKVVAQAGSAVIFADSVDITYRDEPDKADGSSAVITVVGTAVAPAFAADELARELASRAQVVSEAPLMLANVNELTYSAGPGGNVQAGGAISFTLAGVAHLKAVFDPGLLAAALAGKTEGEVDAVRAGFPSLVGPIALKVYPFWMSSLPTNPGRITVDVTGALDQTP